MHFLPRFGAPRHACPPHRGPPHGPPTVLGPPPALTAVEAAIGFKLRVIGFTLLQGNQNHNKKHPFLLNSPEV